MFREIRLQNVRAYSDDTFQLSPYVTVISGRNGSGKTTIAEALYIASRGTSFRSPDSEVLKKGAEWWRIDTQHGDVQRSVLYDPSKVGIKKNFIVAGTKKARLAPGQKLPLVLFEPDDLRLLGGSPARRRTYIDTVAGQLDPQFAYHARRYERALQQRNNLLKQARATPEELFVWDMVLSEAGAYMLQSRTAWLAEINRRIGLIYQDIASKAEPIEARYSRPLHSDDQSHIQQYLLNHLHAAQGRDSLLGYTTVGPHRDDIQFLLNGADASHFASRGETRSIILALKMIEINLLIDILHSPPLVLLDDVFSELDEQRRRSLVRLSGSRVQTVITTTDAEVAKEYSAGGIAQIQL